VVEAMQQFEQNIAEKSVSQNSQGSDGTVNLNSGATPGFVN
jgi:hypothetical protein